MRRPRFLTSYRRPMAITQVMVFSTAYGESGYYVCPRCGCTLEREFTAFCDRCGQRLDWRRREEAPLLRGRLFSYAWA